MDKIDKNVDSIVNENMKWKDAIEIYNIRDLNVQKIYIRRIIVKYSIDKAYDLLEDF
jgi:hypothetical protein